MSTPHPMTIALERGLRSMKIELPDHTQLQLLRYLDEMARWNTAYNLTAIRKAGDMVIRHRLESLALLPILQALPGYPEQIGRAHVCTPVTNAHLVCRLLLE